MFLAPLAGLLLNKHSLIKKKMGGTWLGRISARTAVGAGAVLHDRVEHQACGTVC